jgi:hypothetical protein
LNINKKDNCISVTLKDNRPKRHSVVFAEIKNNVTMVTLTDSFFKYLKGENNGK